MMVYDDLQSADIKVLDLRSLGNCKISMSVDVSRKGRSKR